MTFELAVISAFSGLLGAVVGLLMFNLHRRNARQLLNDRVTKAESDASAAVLKCAALQADLSVLNRDVNDYRVEQADKMGRLKAIVEMQMTNLAEAEKRVARALEDMGQRFDNMSGRLDKFHGTIIEHITKRSP